MAMTPWAKDMLVLEDCTRNFLPCPKCEWLLKVTDLYNGNEKPPTYALKPKRRLQISHGPMKCSNPECRFEMIHPVATNFFELHTQIHHIYCKYYARMMVSCQSCRTRLLADAMYYCKICHGGKGSVVLCAPCAIRDHPGGEEHCLDQGINQNNVMYRNAITTLLYAARSVDERELNEELENVLQKFTFVDLTKTREDGKPMQTQDHKDSDSVQEPGSTEQSSH